MPPKKLVGINKQIGVVQFMLSLLAAIAVTIDKSVDVVSFGTLMDALKSCLGLAPALVFVSFLYFSTRNASIILRKDITTLLLSVALSQCYWIGSKLDNDYEVIHKSLFGVTHWIVVTIGISFALLSLIKVFSKILERAEIINKKGGYTYKEGQIWSRWAFTVCLATYLIYWGMLWPGVVTNDSYWQINQALGFEALSNHHPIMHTLLESLFLKPVYSITGNVEMGIGLFILFQLLMMSLIIAYSQLMMTQIGVNKSVRIGILLFHTINPLFGFYSITMWKDIWMGMLLYLFLLVAIKIVYFGDISVRSLIGLFFCAEGVLFAKATGVAMIGLMTVFIMAFLFKSNKLTGIKLSGVLIFSMICFMIVESIAINNCGVIPSPSRESKSVPLQQIARTVKFHGNELSKAEKDIINEILPYDELAESYNPRLSDPVKDKFNNDAFEQDKKRYVALWISLGKRYPSTYIKSFLNNTYGYWTPDVEYWVITPSSYREVLKRAIDSGAKIYDDPAKYDMSEHYFQRRNIIQNVAISIRRIPGVSLLFSPGAYFWAYAILLLWAIKRNDRKYIVMSSLPLAVFISCLISPLYCEMRYAYPAVIIMPAMACLLALHNSNDEVNAMSSR